jgi:hypothetical protein
VDQQRTVCSAGFTARRRDLVLVLVGAVLGWRPVVAQGQSKRPVVGVLALNEQDNELVRGFLESLEQLG